MKFKSFVDLLSTALLTSSRYRKYCACTSLLNSLSRFRGDTSLSLKTVFSRAFLRSYEKFLFCSGCQRNTISFYMGTLRSIYAQAVSAKLITFDPRLFDDVFTGVDPTSKRAAVPEVIARVLTADLSGIPRLEPCRDYLLLSLQLQGMSFVDLAHLRKSDIQGNMISYYRRKTGTPVQVVMLPGVQSIFDKYADRVEDSPYLLPLVTLNGEAGYRQYQSALHRQNRHLKELTAYLGIQENLTTYVARHTWATLAYHNGVDVGVVSQGMGHHTEGITRTYLASFTQDRLTEANYAVMYAILRPILEGKVGDVQPELMACLESQANEAAGYLAKRKVSKGSVELNIGKEGRRQRNMVVMRRFDK